MAKLIPYGLCAMIMLAVILLYFAGPRFIEDLELRTLDLRFLMRGPEKPGPEVVIAAIDEKSLDMLGRWPWPRSVFADLVKSLSSAGARVIGFDVGFSEPDSNMNLGLIERLAIEAGRLGLAGEGLSGFLEAERRKADNDLILAQAIKTSSCPVVLGYFFHMVDDESVAHIGASEIDQKIKRIQGSHYTFARMLSPKASLQHAIFSKAFLPESDIPVLTEAATASGYFNMFPDPDGSLRWVPMVVQLKDKCYLPLSLQTLRYYLKGAPSSLTVGEAGVEKIGLGDYSLPTDGIGRMLVNYRGPARTFPHYSIADIVKGKLSPETFKDKIVLVGATAVGIYDLRVTPFDSAFPGIEIHANVIDNILHHDFLARPAWGPLFDIGAIVVIGLILGFVLPRLSALTGLATGVVLLVAWVVLNTWLFNQGLWLNLVYPTLSLVAIFITITIYRHMTEEREKKKIKSVFSSYVNPSVVNELMKNPAMLKLGGEKRDASVLFSDIRGFTSISEKLDPEALVHLLNLYLTAMTDIVFKYNGLLDKYIGDAVMAVWSAPLPQADHAVLACRTALEMISGLDRLRRSWKEKGENYPHIDIGIGINSGPMVVGNMGSATRMDYTAMGDAVNLASRLEGANKQYGTNIIIAEGTFEEVKDLFHCRELDSVAVKGKARPARIFELLGEAGQVPERRLNLARGFTMGLTAYKNREFGQATQIFTTLKADYPEDMPTRLYLDRLAELQAAPPPDDWNGVFVMKTK